MSAEEVKIVKLEPIRVASFLGFGSNPEDLAWEKLIAWAKPKGLLVDLEKHRLFGFNNPNPSPGSPNYGYEVWIEIDPDMQVKDEVKTFTFDGGLYAVARCIVPKEQFDVIGEAWNKLVTWCEASQYKHGNHQCLEKSVPLDLPDTEFVLDLYMPIIE